MPAEPSPIQRARREIVEYLRAQTAPLQSAADAHRRWMQQLPSVYDAAKAGRGPTAAINARQMGKQYGPIFRRSLQEAQQLRAPTAAARCQEYLVRWLTSLVNACEALANAPEDGRDSTYLRDCHDYLDDARYAAKPLSEIRTRLYEAAKGLAPGSTRPGGAPTS